jgi:Domain of unknown function (DUF4136)
MKKISFIWMAMLLMVAASAFGQDVRYNFDKNTDFSKFKTYKWVPLKGAAQVNDLVAKQITDAIDSQLATKGLSKTEGDDADLYIGYQVGMTSEKQFTSYDTGWGYGPGWYRGGWYGGGGMGGMTTGSTSTIYVGQLALDMNDSKNKDLVWRGVVSKTIDTNAKPDKQAKNLNKAVAKLLKNYPPKAK